MYYDKAELDDFTIYITASTKADTINSDIINPETIEYIGYYSTIPQLNYSVNSRSINLSWDTPVVYGLIGVQLQVAKAYKIIDNKYYPIINNDDLVWYAPALGLNPYASYDNYKKGEIGDNLVVSGNSISFSVPLFGQVDNQTVHTLYAYRIAGKTVAHSSKYSDPFLLRHAQPLHLILLRRGI